MNGKQKRRADSERTERHKWIFIRSVSASSRLLAMRGRWCVFILLCLLSLGRIGSADPVAADDNTNHKEVHAFFYLWYGNAATDGRILHWDHEILQHWTPAIAAQWPKGKFEPPGDIGATYMPMRGLYSSCDPVVLESQCREMYAAGIDVAVASWWPRGRPDGQGVDTDRCVMPLLDAAAKAGLKVNFHLEPYTDRTPLTVRDDLAYLIEHYSSHPAFYRHPTRHLPMVYVYDAYISPAHEWSSLFDPRGSHTIRGTPLDHVVISLVLASHDRNFLRDSKFDGMYTYFAAKGFTFATTLEGWRTIERWAKEEGTIFIPSVGPGYDDTRIRPWNGSNKRSREAGAYYRQMWSDAIHIDTDIITITSYNEWGEGTQIEPAVPFTTVSGERLQDYGGGSDSDGPNLYMDITNEMVQQFKYGESARRNNEKEKDL